MKKQIRLLGIFILLSSACTTENKIQILPDAKLGQQYSVTIDFNDRISPDSFRVTISPDQFLVLLDHMIMKPLFQEHQK